MPKEGLEAGTVCKVCDDDHDENPYKLTALGSSDVKSYFTEAMVQKVTPSGHMAAQHDCPGLGMSGTAPEDSLDHMIDETSQVHVCSARAQLV